jgi:hypothetical protein
VSVKAETLDDGGWEKWRSLTAEAYEQFHKALLANRPQFPGLASFAAVERARSTKGNFAWSWGAADELQETVNSANAWGMRLHEWGAWNLVLDSYETDEDKWKILSHFVEPVAFFCMLQPHSLVDRLVVAAETLLHQANRCVFPHEPDRLDQDNKPHQRLRPADRRAQLNRLGMRWSAFDAFRDALCAMNGKDYRKVSRDFRNLSAHSFAPRLMVGQVVRAIRSVGPWEEMVKQPDGTYALKEHPTRRGVQYALQAIDPLPLKATRLDNLDEYRKAQTTLGALATLVTELCDRIDAHASKDVGSSMN